MQKKDKQKILDEVWTTDRVSDFLSLTIPEGENADFYLLYSAYKNMRIENFSEFVGLFIEQKRNINAKNSQGETLLDLIKEHKKSAAYVEIIKKVA